MRYGGRKLEVATESGDERSYGLRITEIATELGEEKRYGKRNSDSVSFDETVHRNDTTTVYRNAYRHRNPWAVGPQPRVRIPGWAGGTMFKSRTKIIYGSAGNDFRSLLEW